MGEFDPSAKAKIVAEAEEWAANLGPYIPV